ncbi:hypothetical protein CH1034_240146 [Klebsiella pneumoniae]|nr:hypothetical protein CH1034_240146 [Klebsiella pneumoniae]
MLRTCPGYQTAPLVASLSEARAMRQQNRWLRVQQVVGEGLLGAKAPRLRAIACGNVLSLRSSRTLVEASHPSPWGRI